MKHLQLGGQFIRNGSTLLTFRPGLTLDLLRVGADVGDLDPALQIPAGVALFVPLVVEEHPTPGKEQNPTQQQSDLNHVIPDLIPRQGLCGVHIPQVRLAGCTPPI